MYIAKRVFNRLYPSRPKQTDTLEGDNLRRAIGWSCFLHWFFFLASLTFIGFTSMITQIILGVWSYSCYLTLREWQTIIYMVIMLFAAVGAPFSLFDYINSIQLLLFITSVVFLTFQLLFVFRAYKIFRVTGGIHGKEGTPKVDTKALKKKLKDDIKNGIKAPLLESVKSGTKQTTRGDDEEKAPININLTIGRP